MLVGKPGVIGGDSAEEKDETSGADASPDQVDLEGELVVGDFDLESFPAPSGKMRLAQGLLRDDSETIVDGQLRLLAFVISPNLTQSRMYMYKQIHYTLYVADRLGVISRHHHLPVVLRLLQVNKMQKNS
jgi:hypothetical protein